jgi:nitrate/nitrite transporter NarK
MMFNGVFFGAYIASVYKNICLDKLSDEQLTLAGSIGSLCNGASRIMWATLIDSYGFKRVYFVLLVIQMFVAITMYPFRSYEYFYILCVGLSYTCEGGHFSMFPTAGASIFGVANGGQIFTIMFFTVPLSSNFGFLMVHNF